MSIKIPTWIALYFFLDAYLVIAKIIEVEAGTTMRDFFSTRFVKVDENYRVVNLIGDIKSVKKGTLDETCKNLQLRLLLKSFPLLMADEGNTIFGDFMVTPVALGLDSIRLYDQREPAESWEIGQYEYRLLPVSGTPFKKEIYHVPSLWYMDIAGRLYYVPDGYFALDDINDKGRPLIFDVADDRALLVAYKDTLHFKFP